MDAPSSPFCDAFPSLGPRRRHSRPRPPRGGAAAAAWRPQSLAARTPSCRRCPTARLRRLRHADGRLQSKAQAMTPSAARILSDTAARCRTAACCSRIGDTARTPEGSARVRGIAMIAGPPHRLAQLSEQWQRPPPLQGEASHPLPLRHLPAQCPGTPPAPPSARPDEGIDSTVSAGVSCCLRV